MDNARLEGQSLWGVAEDGCTTSNAFDTTVKRAVARTQFVEAMARIASSVWVVNADGARESPGRTVTAMFPLSADHSTVMISIKFRSRLADVIGAAGRFSLAMLAEGQEKIADAFAGKGEVHDRYAEGDWTQWPSGQPHLLGAVAAFDCVLEKVMPMNDHTLFIGQVIGADWARDKRPLLWYDREYHSVSFSRT
ncbi:flavin reductase family protein [Thioclava sp. GXIMD4215]|uniref:flavin reductase family protein n=1 Tax=Thioclava sp. GXIMD4215 TaxID=3131928 RepID=UPI00324E32C6